MVNVMAKLPGGRFAAAVDGVVRVENMLHMWRFQAAG
jgi:hypothetical protein